MRGRLTILIILSAVCLLAGDGARAGQNRPRISKKPPPAIDADALRLFKGIERAWGAGDAQKLASYAGESKVFLSVGGLGEKGGYFSRSQVFYLFKGMFKSTKHKRFEFVSYHEVSEKGNKIYGIARRDYQNVSNGRLFQDKIYVTLKQEGKRWVVSEMKSAR